MSSCIDLTSWEASPVDLTSLLQFPAKNVTLLNDDTIMPIQLAKYEVNSSIVNKDDISTRDNFSPLNMFTNY